MEDPFKGIFEVRGVFFLVSVSDEATRSLKMGGVAGRDEFNSSFYAVIEVPPMDDAFLAELFNKRGTPLQPRVATVISLLAGNNPRETLRLADFVLSAGAESDVSWVVSAAMRAEVRAFRAYAMTSTAPGSPNGLSDDERARLAATLDNHRFAADRFADTARDLMNEWTPAWSGPYWMGNLQNPWGRLLIRLQVAAEALSDHADMTP
ncbi:MAG: hypothetical protein ACXVHQ_39455, partial [Solirubrobacteraceae bacterium]